MNPENQKLELNKIISKGNPQLTFFVMVLVDVFLLAGSLFISAELRYQFEMSKRLSALYFQLWPSLGVFVLLYGLLGLYSGVTYHPAEELRRLTYSTTLVYFLLAALSFLLKDETKYSRFVFFLAWMLSVITLPLGRSIVRNIFGKRAWWGRSVIILGAGKTGAMVISTLKQNPELGLKPVLCLDDDPQKWGTLQGVPVIGGLGLIPTVAAQLPDAYAILAMPGMPRENLLKLIERDGIFFPHLFLIPDLFGFSSLWLTAKDLGGILGLELRQQLLLPGPQIAKRFMDALIFLVVIIPIILMIPVVAFLIRLDSPGPVFYRQPRLGRDGHLFNVLKFRTMYVDAEKRLTAMLESDPALREEYRQFHKLRNDPRITRIGAVLRKTSLDEIPQIWNVFRGEMSFVGPRAYLSQEFAQMESKDKTILRVLPGITGIWQVSGRSQLTFPQRLDMDVYYVRNWSIWLDIYLLARTGWAVLTAKGAF